MEYVSRRSLTEKEKIYRLSRDELTILSAAGSLLHSIPLASVRSVRLQFLGTGFGFPQYRCVIKAARKVVLANCHYLNLGEFEDRGQTYRPFIEQLHQYLLPFSHQIRFKQGSGLVFYTCLAGVLAMPFLVIGGIAAWIAGAFGTGLFAAIGVPLLLGYVCPPVLRKGRPQDYDPAAVPEKFLP